MSMNKVQGSRSSFKGDKPLILLTGGRGQLGTELRYLLDEKEVDYLAPNSQQLDITDKEGTYNFITELRPDFIFHCAAYTAVDQAEETRELDEKINVAGTYNVAEAAKMIKATLLYISTDYVFDGRKKDEYKVDDFTNPLNEYGRTKLLGEQAVQEIMDEYYIIRTSWVFGSYGTNFVAAMKKLACKQKRLTVVADQFGRPTWTRTLAEFMLFVIENNTAYGVYHLANENSCSWYEFAKEILKDSEVEIVPVTSEKYPQKAVRPKYSVMDLSKTKALGFEIPTWQVALEKSI